MMASLLRGERLLHGKDRSIESPVFIGRMFWLH
jgi:hypothetical protein